MKREKLLEKINEAGAVFVRRGKNSRKILTQSSLRTQSKRELEKTSLCGSW
jgi:ABC-type tungstate transport system permease subunit